ncbi:hypothetical protein UlMin_005341 [Ulmus minor]
MNFSTRRSHDLQGPRPSSLAISRNSGKIDKSRPNRAPVVVYLRSPKIIHVQPEEFMSLVQQLTGNDKKSKTASASSSSTSSAVIVEERVVEKWRNVNNNEGREKYYNGEENSFSDLDFEVATRSSSSFAVYPSYVKAGQASF